MNRIKYKRKIIPGLSWIIKKHTSLLLIIHLNLFFAIYQNKGFFVKLYVFELFMGLTKRGSKKIKINYLDNRVWDNRQLK